MSSSGSIDFDTGSMYRIGYEIKDLATSLTKNVEELTTEITSKVGDSGTIWKGPQAREYVSNFKKKAVDFETAANNIKSAGDTLVQHADAWVKFEGN